MKKKVNIPQKGAAKKWSKKLKEMGQLPPPRDLVEILNQPEEYKYTPKSLAAWSFKNEAF